MQNNLPFEPLLGTREAIYDPTKFNWLGSPSIEVGLIAVWKTVPVNTIDDLKGREITVGSSGIPNARGKGPLEKRTAKGPLRPESHRRAAPRERRDRARRLARGAGGRRAVRHARRRPRPAARRPGAEARILEDLRWLGLDWDEGPDVGGPFAPYRQSERFDLYADALSRLRERGELFACACSRTELRSLASAPHGPGSEGPRYGGRCRFRGLPVDVEAGVALRFVAPGGKISVDDRIAGRYCQDVAAEIGDFVVRRADGLYSYQLALVVDDAAMAVTQVVRGEDLLHSTPRQVALQRSLGLPEPEYAHVPLVLNPAGERLAKRDRAAAVRALRESGVAPERVVGLLARSLGLVDAPDPVRPADLVPLFAWDRLVRSPWRIASDSR